MEKDVQEAIKLIAQVCAAFNGNLEQHKNIQNALKKVEESLVNSNNEDADV